MCFEDCFKRKRKTHRAPRVKLKAVTRSISPPPAYQPPITHQPPTTRSLSIHHSLPLRTTYNTPSIHDRDPAHQPHIYENFILICIIFFFMFSILSPVFVLISASFFMSIAKSLVRTILSN